MLGDMRRRGRRRRVGLGGSERLLSSPAPLFYTRHTARFLSMWFLLLPFTMYDPFKGSLNHIAEIPAIALASVFLSIDTNSY